MNCPSSPAMLSWATDLVSQASERNISLRILGSVAVQYFVKPIAGQRPAPIKDVDFITVRTSQMDTQRLLKDNGWEIANELLMFIESRETFTARGMDFTIDVYYDKVDGSHPIDLARRLLLSSPTIPWTDLLVSKLQRRQLRVQDVWDCCNLLSRKELLEPGYLCQMVGTDWALSTLLLDNLADLVKACSPNDDSIRDMITLLKSCPKSLRWRARSLLGRRLKWWKEMSEASVIQD